MTQLQQDLKNVPPILPAAERKKLLEVIFRGLGIDYCSEEQNLILRGFANENITARKDQLLFLSPPVQRCIKCNTSLQCHNKPSEVMVYKMDGAMKTLNMCWRCENCDLNYNYCRFGDKKDGYQFYDIERPYIQSTNCSFVDRQLCRYQIFLS